MNRLKQKLAIKYNSFINFKNRVNEQVDESRYMDAMVYKVTPSKITEKMDYLIINEGSADESYTKCRLVGVPDGDKDGYPRKIPYQIIDRLTELNTFGCTITYSVTFVPISREKSTRMLQSAITKNLANQISSVKSNVLHNVDMALVFDQEDFTKNLRLVHELNQKMFHTVFTILISADSIAALRVAEGRVIQRLKSHSIESEAAYGIMLKTWKNAMPFPGYLQEGSVEMFSNEASVIAPLRTPNSITDNVGLYFGKNVKTKKHIQIDLEKLIAQHILFVGPSGAGKTFTMLMLLMRAHDMLDKRIIFITNKDDKKTNYGAVPTYYNGAYIKVGPDETDASINPLKILFDTTYMTSNYDYIRAYNNHKGLLQQFFKIWFNYEITINQISKLDMYLDKVYKNFGIHKEDPASWIDATWPLLRDLRALFEVDARVDVTAQALYDKTYQLSENGELAYLNRPSNIDLSKDMVVIDTSKVPTQIAKAMDVFVIGILGLRFRTDTSKETIIAVDEAGNIMKDPVITAFILKMLTQSRSYGIALWVGTQQPTDLDVANVSEEFQTNMVINIILGKGLNKLSMPIIAQYFKLNLDQQLQLKSSPVGSGFLMINDKGIHVEFKPTDHELQIITAKNEIIEPDVAMKISPELLKLAIEHNFFATEWIDGDASHILKNNGYLSRSVITPVGRGLTSVWIKSEIMSGEKIGTQSVDHFATVMIIAGHLINNGWTVEVNHMQTADILAEYEDVRIAIEYERPGSHSESELKEKAIRIEQQQRLQLFVVQTDNMAMVQKAVGENYTFKRGKQLVDHLDSLIVGK